MKATFRRVEVLNFSKPKKNPHEVTFKVFIIDVIIGSDILIVITRITHGWMFIIHGMILTSPFVSLIIIHFHVIQWNDNDIPIVIFY